MVKKLFILGLLLLIPGGWTLLQAWSLGPASWALNQSILWGTPIVHFVFWIGLAHAGTFISAILLIFEVRFQKRISFVAELSTIAALFVAALFPLIHLGIVSRFYFLVPFFNERNMFVNFDSPLIWDFLAIGAYACLSILFFITHIVSLKKLSFLKTRKVLAWILFPLVLWVHTIVSLDFAVTTNPLWQGTYFPIYFIIGAIFSGLALVMLLLELMQKRVRRIEDLLLAGSWIIFVFWIWELIHKGVIHSVVLIFGFVFMQLFWLPRFRNIKAIRLFVSFSVLLAMWLERYFLIVHTDIEWLSVDWGWFALGIGLFLSIFFGAVLFFQKHYPQVLLKEPEKNYGKYSNRMILKIVSGAVLLTLLFWFLNYNYDPSVSLMNWIPALFPVFSVIVGLSFFSIEVFSIVSKRPFFIVSGIGVLVFSFLFFAFYKGGDTDLGNDVKMISVEQVSQNQRSSSDLWKSRCASCHGLDGKGNRKFIYEYYPEIQDLSLERLDQQGEDSLTNVVLQGRAFMNPFKERLSESEARSLVRYMYHLAEDKHDSNH